MKTLIKKDRVTHAEFGNGTVVSVLKGGAMIEVDFNGTLRSCRVSELSRAKQNTYTPPPPQLTQVLAEVQKLQQMVKDDMKNTDPLQSDYSKGCNAYAKMIDGRIEAILQGGKF